MKTIFTLFILGIFSFPGIAQPVINSFTPLSASTGNPVTIDGSGFSAIATDNTVYFGNVKANVINSTATTIVANVPAAAAYAPISVTNGGLTAFSLKRFAVSFPGGGNFASNHFSAAQKMANVYKPCFADFDNDGNLDVAGESLTNYLQVYRNTGTTGEPSFSSTSLQLNANPVNCIAAADINGDGKLDIIVTMVNSTALLVFKNTSTAGTISFDSAPFVFNFISDNPAFICTADLDGNGKTDIIVSKAGSGSFGVLPNTSVGGIISFGAKQQFAYGFSGSSEKLLISDIDNDGKYDVSLCSHYFAPILVFLNNSTPGTISFLPKLSINSGKTGAGNPSLDAGDVDGDGKADMVLSYDYADSFFIFRNTGSPGSVSFAPRLEYKTVRGPSTIVLNDFDGDAKPDISVQGSSDTITIHKNNSTSGLVSMGLRNDYQGVNIDQVGSMSAADVDADGKADLLISYYSTNPTPDLKAIYVLRNQSASPVINSAIPITASQGQTVTIRGSRFVNVTAVSFGNTAAASYNVLSDTVITAVVGGGNSGNVKVTTQTGTGSYAGFIYSSPIPTIDSIVPLQGNAGTNVSIYGKNFNTTASENIVYFGTGIATVNSASATVLHVTAPVWESYSPVTVAIPSLNLSASSAIPFDLSFPVTQNSFTNASFADTVRYSTTETVSSICPADFDGDGKTDFAVSEANSSIQMSVFRNQSMDGSVGFAPRIIYKVSEGTVSSIGRPLYATTADINGDGKPDIVASSGTRDSMSVFINTSTAGSMSFAPKKDFSTGDEPNEVKCNDLDADGKPDIIVANGQAVTVSIYKNISTAANTILQSPQQIPVTGNYLINILCTDIDGDGKAEIIAAGNNIDSIEIFRNESTPGTLNFAGPFSLASGFTSAPHLYNADLDGDGRQDIISIRTGGFSIFRNTSTPGNISFAARIDSAVPVYDLTVTDINGDGKPDMLFCNSATNIIYIYPNQSTPGNLAFGNRADINKNFSPGKINAADVTGDGKPDLICYAEPYKVVVLKNKFGDTATAVACPSLVNITIQSSLAGTVYQWQVNTGTGYANISNGVNYSGVNIRNLSLINIPSSNYGNLYRCIVDGINSDATMLKIENKWKGGTGAWELASNWSCGTVPDSFTDVIISSGNAVINSNVTVRSVTANNPASITVTAGFNFSVLH